MWQTWTTGGCLNPTPLGEGDAGHAEQGLVDFFGASDVGDLEEPFGRVVEEPGQRGGFGRILPHEDAGGLVVVAQLDGVVGRAGKVRPMGCDEQLLESDSELFEASVPAQQIKVIHDEPLLNRCQRARPDLGARATESFAEPA